MSIKLIIFDVDNTIVPENNSRDFYYQYHTKLRDLISSKNYINKDIIEEKIKNYILLGLPTETLLDYFNIKRIFLYDSLMKIRPDRYLKPNPFINKIFKDINKKEIKIGILTDSPRPLAEKIIKSLKIKNVFIDFIIGWERDGSMPKNGSIEIYKNICNKYEIKPSEAIMIGDSLRTDILPAQKIGLQTIYVNKKDDKYNGIRITSLELLPEILKNYFKI